MKFPRTPHLIWLGETPPRDDKLLDPTEVRLLFEQPVSVEEKVDGANLGISVGPDERLRAQNRGSYLEPSAKGQFRTLWRWLDSRQGALVKALGLDLVAFGEWCYARHSIPYNALPDWFLLFDVYDSREKRFWSRERRDAFAHDAGLAAVPLIATGVFDSKGLAGLVGGSRLGSGPAEGLYLRWDAKGWLVARAKVVRPGWTPVGDAHWSSRPLETNQLREGVDRARTEAKSL